MGNSICSCAHKKRRRSESDRYAISDIKSESDRHAQSTTPYDNGPHFSLSSENNNISHKNNEDSELIEEQPIFKKECHSEFQSPNVDQISSIGFRSCLTSNNEVARTTSLFSYEDILESEDLPNIINADLYSIVLREFLISYYPINDEIINEMAVRSLLLEQDSKLLLSLATDREKSESFLSNFVFSEMNICKLATFLYVLVTEKSQILQHFNKSDDFFRSVVDHIYYVVNFLSLLAECFGDDERMTNNKSLSSIVNINCVPDVKVLKKKRDPFFVKVYICGVSLSPHFLNAFSCINQHYHCCQELSLSSCNLVAKDMLDLCLGFKVSGVLRSLNVSSNALTDEGLAHIESLLTVENSLHSLNVACCSLTAVGVERLLNTASSTGSRSALRRLSLSHNDLRGMSERGVLLLTRLSLTRLDLEAVNLRQQRVLFQSLKLNYSLKTIDLGRNRLFSNDLTYLAAGIAYNGHLETVALNATGLLRADCATLNNALLMNKGLTSIDLSDNLIGDEGALLLKDIFVMKTTLRRLYLRRCGISLQGTLVLLRTVGEAECRLDVIDLCYNRSSRTSVVVDARETARRIGDLVRHILLVRDVKILLWGTLDEWPIDGCHGDCLDL